MNSMRFAWFCAFFAQGCFDPGSGSTPADTDTDADSNGTVSDSMSSGSAVTSVTNSSMTSEPTTTSPTSPTDASETITTGPETESVSESDSDTLTGTSGVEAQCGDGIPVPTELCFDDTPVSYDVGPGAVDLGVGDITANGLLDIVVFHNDGGDGRLTILEADGVGGFIEGDTPVAPGFGGSIAVVDIDDDGDADVFAIGGSGLMYFRNESAFFLDYEPPNFFGGSGEVADVHVADVDGDDVPDVLASQAYSHTWYRGAINSGNWAFAADSVAFPTIGEGASGMIPGAFSFDGDDDLDLVGLNQYYSTVEVLTNDGNGNYTGHSTVGLCSGEFDGLRFGDWGDLDGDGNSDLVGTCMAGDVGLAFDDGTGTFATSDTLALAGAYRATVADLDDDGAPDILVTSTTLMRAVIFHNDGSGAFELSDTQFMGTGPVQGAAVADLNDDGALDVVVASGGPSSHVDVYFAMP